jgi:hypothetical protein
MLNLMNRMAAAGALLMLNGAVALAQSEIKVDVPFTFHTAGATMAPGKYAITKVHAAAVPYYKLRHESGKAILVAPYNLETPRTVRTRAELAFACAGEYCALKSIDGGFGSPVAVVPVRIEPGFRGEKVADVRIPATR